MRIGYFDCFCGASGDMILAALVDAGLPPEVLRAELAKLPIGGYEINIRRITQQGFRARKVDITHADEPGHRHLNHIIEIIDSADLTRVVKDRATRVFTRLAEAEAAVHGTGIDEVHFHEVGAVDAIVDIVGAAVGIDRLGLQRIVCSPIPTGSGTVRCDHGTLPVPAPATAQLLIDVPLADCEEPGELTTPTGAAILTTLADHYGSLPPMRLKRCGYGAGTRQGRTRPNLLRLLVGESIETDDEGDEIIVIEANLDDATGEQVGHVFELLLAAGALDVFTTPITMKKNRPGILLSVLAPLDRTQACEDIVFAETTTFGLRRHACSRRKLRRTIEAVSTRFGEIRVKLGRRQGQVVLVSPEYEDCARASRESGVPLRKVMFEARRVWQASSRAKDG